MAKMEKNISIRSKNSFDSLILSRCDLIYTFNMVSLGELRVYYLGRFGDQDEFVFITDSGLVGVYLPKSSGYLFYSDRKFMNEDDFVIGSERIDQWSFCSRCGKNSGNLSDMNYVGLVHERLEDGVDVSPRSLRIDIHNSFYTEEGAEISNAWICGECQTELSVLLNEAIEDRSDKIASLIF